MRVAILGILCLFLFWLVGCSGDKPANEFSIDSATSPSPWGSTSKSMEEAGPVSDIKILSAKPVPYKLPNTGDDAQMVMIDWQNTGRKPIYFVRADIIAKDSAGNRLDSSEDNYVLYNRSTPITPDQIAHKRTGEGLVLRPAFGNAEQIEVRVTKVGVIPLKD